MRREKMNNKGFSLVQLIIVIAIMAILSAALAPQLMKYIEKSRKSTDQSSCTSIESCVNAALAEEKIYKEVASKGNGADVVIKVKVDDSTGTITFNAEKLGDNNTTGTSISSEMCKELNETLASLKAPKQTGKTQYEITIKTGSATDGTTSVGKISVKTIS